MSGIYEDPATGSATGPLGAYLVKYDLIERRDGLRFTSEQGTKMGRQSFIHARLRIANDVLETVEIGGSAVRVIEGRFSLPALSHAP
jgi:trans-2,3-dihydro-3-hydroxyanthranilate isomerase